MKFLLFLEKEREREGEMEGEMEGEREGERKGEREGDSERNSYNTIINSLQQLPRGDDEWHSREMRTEDSQCTDLQH